MVKGGLSVARQYIANTLKRLRESSGKTADEVGKLIGKSGKTVNAWENNRGQPDIEILMQLCEIYNVDNILEEFAPIESQTISTEKVRSESNEYDENTQSLLTNYNRLNDQGQHEVRKRAAELTEIPRYLKDEPESKIITLDMDSFEMPASAGTGMFLSDEYKEVIQVKDCYEARTADFVIPIAGDSMEPLYSDGDRVFVKSMPMVEVGEIGIFVINGDAYIKKRGRDRLISLNRKRKDIVFREGDTIVCLGKVIGKVEE